MIFRDITIIGEENIPLDGPLILSINHNSQYVDALLLFNLRRKLNFIVAGSSSRTKILGTILKTIGFIPTERPMDHKKEGSGRLVKLENGKIYGNGTNFTELHHNDSIVPVNESLGSFRVK